MPQLVYVLELLRPGGVVRAHFAQTEGAARRAAGARHRLEGRWLAGPDREVVAQLWAGQTLVAQVRRETLDD
ncbi:hypothetical protein [Deinococcus sonorensis]|uniref:Methyltransferase n=2 Tax=Deinococcus sonorensis TaxID=309891 RepID=A0AAU7U7W2_9DEIO